MSLLTMTRRAIWKGAKEIAEAVYRVLEEPFYK